MKAAQKPKAPRTLQDRLREGKTQRSHQTGARNEETGPEISTMRRLRKHIGRQLGPHGGQKVTVRKEDNDAKAMLGGHTSQYDYISRQ